MPSVVPFVPPLFRRTQGDYTRGLFVLATIASMSRCRIAPMSQLAIPQPDAATASRTPILKNIAQRLGARSSAFLLAAIVTVSTGLSLYWVFTVPIFQAPDEFTHFDYAMNIYSAGRLITCREPLREWNAPPWSLHCFTQYLINECDFSSMQYNSQVKAPPGYGTKAFY